MKTQKIYGPHSKVQVVMMRGLVEKWKQPIWFHFDTTMTKKLLDYIIIKMESNSFEIRAIVCDLGNHTLRSQLGIDKGNFFFTNLFDCSRVVYIFPDSPNLLKLWIIEEKIPDNLKLLLSLNLFTFTAKEEQDNDQSKEARAKENASRNNEQLVRCSKYQANYDKVKAQISAGGDDDHPGAVGAMKRMIILEIGKNCETLVSNPAVQIEKEYDVYRIEDEEEKRICNKANHWRHLRYHNCSCGFCNKPSTRSVQKWDLNFEGLSYISGFIAHKMKLLHPNLGKKTSDIYLNDHGLTLWIYHLSRGGLMVPSDNFFELKSFRPEVQGIPFTSIRSSSKNEGYVMQQIEYSKGRITGLENMEPAKTLLCFLINCISGHYKGTAAIIPVSQISSELIQTSFYSVLKMVSTIGFDFVLIAMSANFNHIRELYEKERLLPVRYAPKLTDNVIHPRTIERTCVKLADSCFHDSTISGLRTFAETNQCGR
ncbi:unnamed protein product [Lepeophtheirus salmonis]|uniref:(salmon louse) hypothetical protein n=1 Tax=Lepeophtheirus salmonis TaxID=72036 RepID=A0A7R8H5D3_LEPSM|nr:unnamed protein product [Lepeophtheirus salmonis]CAF2861572.1 unnamed protein product [Lepeophtheirus salmonis]